ncbi:MAG TPA: MFS transporter [Streptosporangiaceae bacterium]|nr:MFS transporter [Streptosporangiaceae bacterium]
MFAYRSILREQARPAVVRESRRAPWLAVSVVCFGAFMGQLDASIVTITFPAMEHDFGVPVAAVQWVSLAYLLGLVAMLAPAGRLGDAAGRKLVYTYGFAVFSVASAACGLASSLGVLVGLRLLQATGAAMLQANSVALVTTNAPKARMRFALGIQAGAQAAGLALGPTLGGLLTATAGWRAVYWVNVPVGVVAVIAGRYLLPRTRQFSRPGRFDGPGAALLVTWTTALLLALSAVSGLSLPPGLAVLLAVLALGSLAAFVRREIRTVHPLIPVWLLRSRPLALGLAGAGCGYLALFGPLVLIPQVLARGPGSVARTGLLLSALPLGFGLAALLGDLVLPRGWEDRRRGLAGALLACAAMAAATVIPLTQATVVPLLAVGGAGLGIFVPANNTVIMRSVTDSSASLVGGLVSMARGIGTTLGISLMALAWHLGSHSYQAGNPGYAGTEQARPAFGLLAAAAAMAAVIAVATREKARGQPLGPGEATRQVQSNEGGIAQEQVGHEQIGPELAGLVSRLRRAMRRAARAADPALGLSVAQLELLSCITEHPGIRPSQLARMLRLAPSSVATLLGGLQSAGYVTRTPGADSAGDRRTVSLDLSEAGTEAVTRWHRVNEDIIQAALAQLPHRERAALRDAAPALRDLTAAIDAQAD